MHRLFAKARQFTASGGIAGDWALEHLEKRTMLSVGLDTGGWTRIEPSQDTLVIYVSSSEGHDDNLGTSPEQAVATIAAGYSRLRHGHPDWLLLKRGDTFNAALGAPVPNQPGQYDWADKSGRSSDEPMVVASYGFGERPVLATNDSDGFSSTGQRTLSHLVLMDLHFRGNGSHEGIWIYRAGADLLFENLMIESYAYNVAIQTSAGVAANMSDIRLRRNVIVDAYNTAGGKSQGMYGDKLDRLVLEENVFDHNGWKDTADSLLNHTIYLRNVSDLVVRGNILADGASMGLNISGDSESAVIRPLIENNLFLRNGNTLSIGAGSYAYSTRDAVIHDNVFTETGRQIAGMDQSFGLELKHADGLLVDGNLFAHKANAGTSWTMRLWGTLGYRNVRISNNVSYAWNNSQLWYSSGPFENVRVETNIIQDDTYSSGMQVLEGTVPGGIAYADNAYYSNASRDQWFRVGGFYNYRSISQWLALTGETGATFEPVSFPDPDRSIALYDTSIGSDGSVESFLAGARRQSRDNWRIEYTAAAANNFMRQGFGMMVPSGITVSPATDPATCENGTSTSFQVVLNRQPLADVVVPVASSDTTEGTVNVTSLTFTPANWNVAQAVIVTGSDDDATDGDTRSFLRIAPALSSDPGYAGIDAEDVPFTTIDDDTLLFGDDPFLGNLSNYWLRTELVWQTDCDGTSLRLSVQPAPADIGVLEYALIRNRIAADFRISTLARAAKGAAGQAGTGLAIVFGYVNQWNYVLAVFDPAAFTTSLVRVSGGNALTMATASTAGLQDDEYHRIEAERVGGTVTLRVDGEMVIAAVDTALESAGRLGIGATGGNAWFDDINVIGASEPALEGDLNLDGRLDGDDYFLMDSEFLRNDGGYPVADLDADGQVSGADYYRLDRAYLLQDGSVALEAVSSQTNVAMAAGRVEVATEAGSAASSIEPQARPMALDTPWIAARGRSESEDMESRDRKRRRFLLLSGERRLE